MQEYGSATLKPIFVYIRFEGISKYIVDNESQVSYYQKKMVRLKNMGRPEGTCGDGLQ